MKKVFCAIMVIAAITLVGCKDKKDEPQLQPKKDVVVTKITDYLYEYEADNYGTEAPAYVMADYGRIPIFGCSSVRNGNFYGRNLDFNINELCEFVVRTKATATRKHASIGVVNPIFLTITNDKVQEGLSDSVLNYLPWMTMDGINDAGLVCNINVVNTADIKNVPHKNTNEGALKIMVMNLVRALLDNCGSVEEAKAFILNHDIMPIPTTWDGHIMIADPNSTVIVEFTGGDTPQECVKFVTPDGSLMKPIMTNFYNHLFEKRGDYPNHACGEERHRILEKNYATSNSMQGMWELMKKVHYTQAYDVNVEPFWCSEYYDIQDIPDFESKPKTYWTKDKVLEQAVPVHKVEAYERYKATGEYNLEDGLWFTTHNSTYDIVNKILWVTIREKYEKHYEFKLK